MPFFIRGKNAVNGNKKPNQANNKRKKIIKSNDGITTTKKARLDEDEITSDEDEEFINKIKENHKETTLRINGFSEETAEEIRERKSREYLAELKKEYKDKENDKEIHKEISARLKKNILEAHGNLQNFIADTLDEPSEIKFLKCKHHSLALTCLVVSFDEKLIFTASKDCAIVKWTIDGERKGIIHRIPNDDSSEKKGHASHILSLAISSDGKFLASGDRNGLLHIWDPETLSHIKTFTKHRKGKAVSGLAFRQGTHNLFSASHDRMVLSWNLDAMAFSESLGGHQDCITGIDCLQRESCITSGGRDEMVIVYVLLEDKQLRFSSNCTSIDGIKLLNEKTFVTFAQDGSISLWSTIKKKPHGTIKMAHGVDPMSGVPNWISAVGTLINSDIVASGSNDGFVRLWKVEKGFQKLVPLHSVKVPGVVNHLQFTRSGSHLIAAVGKEPKLGRWYVDKQAKNALVVIPLNFSNKEIT